MCLLKPSESAEQLALATEFWADWYSGKRTTVSTMFLLGAYAQTTDEEFRASLRNWQDFDGAAHCLGLRLGMFPPDRDWYALKSVFWANNPLGNFLHEMLLGLCALGQMEHDHEECQFRVRG